MVCYKNEMIEYTSKLSIYAFVLTQNIPQGLKKYMARSGENFRGKWLKQIKNTCTSVTGIVDEVYTDIATHNKWGLSLARTRDCGKRHWQIIFILTVLTRLSHAGTTLALQKYSFDITGNKLTHTARKKRDHKM